MRKITNVECYDIPSEITSLFDEIVEEECLDKGIFGSSVKDVAVEYFFGERDLDFFLCVTIDFFGASFRSLPSILYCLKDASWQRIYDKIENG